VRRIQPNSATSPGVIEAQISMLDKHCLFFAGIFSFLSIVNVGNFHKKHILNIMVLFRILLKNERRDNMIDKRLEKQINYQINRELYSAYLYLSMSSYLEDKGLAGMANFMKVQAEEENFHAMKFFNYLVERGGRVVLDAIEKPPAEFDSPQAVFTESLKHEKIVTDLINKLMDLAIEVNDHAARSFLNWYVDEQVEEEDSFQSIIDKLDLVGGKGHGLLMLDKDLGARVFTPPAEG
jgi:ferritin